MLKRLILGSACTAAMTVLSAATAYADAPNGFAGTVSGTYGRSDCSGCGSADAWGVSGQGAFGLGMSDLGGEVDLGYQHISSGGFSTSGFGAGGSLFWAPTQWRLGGSVTYAQIDVPGPNVDVWSYGAFGEYYLAPQFTIGLAGGGLNASGSGASATGDYITGGAIGYILPDLALTGTIGSTHIDKGVGSITNYGITAEWLISEMTPVSIYAGYSATDLPHGLPTVSTWIVGIKFYADPASRLVDHHRNGALDSLVNVNQLGLQTAF